MRIIIDIFFFLKKKTKEKNPEKNPSNHPMALFGIIMCKFLQVLFECMALICNQNNRFTPE